MLLSISGCSDVGSATLGCSPNSSLTIRGDDFTYFNTARPGYEPLAFSISFTVPRAVFGARTWYFTFSNRSMPHNQTIVVQLAPTAQWGDLLTAWFTNVDVPQPVWMRTSEFITNTVNISFKAEADVVVSSLVPCTTIPAAGKLPGITAMDLLGAYVLWSRSVLRLDRFEMARTRLQDRTSTWPTSTTRSASSCPPSHSRTLPTAGMTC